VFVNTDALLPDPNAKGEMHIFCGLSTVKIITASSQYLTALRMYCSANNPHFA